MLSYFTQRESENREMEELGREKKNKKQRKVGLLYDERMCKHHTPDGEFNPENPNRIRAIWNKLLDAGIPQRCVLVDAKEAEDKYILSVHSQNHLKRIKTISSKKFNSPKARIAQKYDSIYFNEGSSEAACLAAGSVIEVTKRVGKGELNSAVAIIRPPGHHAEQDEPMGFCLYNNVAIATSFLLNEKPELGIKKILIVDWDVHHGNGTQKMFYEDPRVLFFSVHRHDFGSSYPANDDGFYTMVGEGAAAGYNINVPWENDGCGDADYLAVWDHILLPVAKEFNPDIILISAGFDAAVHDPLGGCCVTPYGYSVMLKQLMSFSHGKIVLALEGGYNLESIANAMLACVEVLLEDKPLIGSLVADPLESTWRVIQVVRQELSAFWPALAKELPKKLINQITPAILHSSSDFDVGENEGPNVVSENFKEVHKVIEQLKVDEGQVWRSDLSNADILYATFGSNMSQQRFLRNLEGGQDVVAKIYLVGDNECFTRLKNVLSPEEWFPAKITVKSTFHAIRKIWNALPKPLLTELRRSCFGHFTELDDLWTEDPQKKSGFCGQFVHYIMTRKAKCNKKQELWFNIDGKPARFSIHEFALVTGLVCGKLPSSLRKEATQRRLQDTYWKTNQIRMKDLLEVLEKWPRGKPEEDKLKIALLYFLEATILSSDPKKIVSQEYMSMVDDLETFNAYPWGTIAYASTIEQLQNKDMKAKFTHYKQHLEAAGKKATYTLFGFPFAFMIWCFEVIPKVGKFVGVMVGPKTYPRCLNWRRKKGKAAEATTIKNFVSQNQIVVHSILKPMKVELTKPWMQGIHCPEEKADTLLDNEIFPLLSDGQLVSDPAPATTSTTASAPKQEHVVPPSPQTTQPQPQPDWFSAQLTMFESRITSYIDGKVGKIMSRIDEVESRFNARFDEQKAIATTLIEKFNMVLATLVGQAQHDLIRDSFISTAGEILEKKDDRSAYETPPTIIYDDNVKMVEGDEVISVMLKNPAGEQTARARKRNHYYMSPHVNVPAKIGRWAKGKPVYNVLGWFDEAKYKDLMQWLNQSDVKVYIEGGTSDLKKNFFTDLLRKNGWLTSEHIDEALYFMRKRNMMFKDIFPQDVIILDDVWSQMVSGRYRDAVEKKVLQNYKCPDELLKFCRGEQPLMGSPWVGAKFLYAPVNIRNKHWVGMAVDIEQGELLILDCDPNSYTDKELLPIVEPFAEMIPILLLQSKMFFHLDRKKLTKKWPWARPKGVCTQTNTSGECGIYAIKFMELHMMHQKLDALTDENCFEIRKRLASAMFTQDMDPCNKQ